MEGEVECPRCKGDNLWVSPECCQVECYDCLYIFPDPLDEPEEDRHDR